jgi:hypothetical protein
MPYQRDNWEAENVVITAAATTATVFIGNPAELGFCVPALVTNATVVLKVGALADGSDARIIVDQAGTQKLSVASGVEDFCFSSNEMGACLGYGYLTVVIGAAQAANATFVLHRKKVAVG